MAEFINILGPLVPRTEIMQQLKKDVLLYEQFLLFPDSLKEEFLQFCEGAKGLKITYDPFFKKIFSPEEHPHRLEALLSTILEQPVKIQQILSREGMQVVEKGSLVIMDIIVSLADGTMVNVEMQKVGYAFPAERSECYASDMTMRQYSVAKQLRGKKFTFHDLKPVIVIVIMESSPISFQTPNHAYLHKRIVSYDTQIQLPTLHNICYITLDIFKENIQNISTDIEAWMTFLASDNPADILKLMEYHPIFKEMYHDMAEFRKDVKEVVAMYSEALKIMDHNTELYMIEEQQKEIEELQTTLAERNARIAEKDAHIAEKDARIAELEAKLAEIAK